MNSMTDYNEAQAKRDQSLANRSANAADAFSLYLKTWIQEEIIALYPRVNALADSPSAPGPLKAEYEQARKELEELNRHELNDVYEKFNESLTDIREGVYESCLAAHQYVQDALSGLERVIRRLLRLRKDVDFWMGQPEDKGEETEEGNETT